MRRRGPEPAASLLFSAWLMRCGRGRNRSIACRCSVIQRVSAPTVVRWFGFIC
jgi:hypothetical protein